MTLFLMSKFAILPVCADVRPMLKLGVHVVAIAWIGSDDSWTLGSQVMKNVEHLYSIGQEVNLESGAGFLRYPSRPFKIIAKLPSLAGEFQYRVKSIDEIYERMVSEYSLVPIPLQNHASP